MTIVESLKESIGILSAAIIGAFIGTASKRTDSPLAMIVSVVAGISSAYIFTPIISGYLGMVNRVDYAIAFLLGLLGMSVISIVLAVLEALKDNPKEIITFIKDLIFKNKTTVINNYKSEDNKNE